MLSCVCRSISVPGLVSRIQWGIVNRTSSSDELQNALFYSTCAPPAAAHDGGSHRQTVGGGLLGERPLTGNHWQTSLSVVGVLLQDI